MKRFLRAILKPLSFVPALVMLYTIFSFSSQNGVESADVSLKVSRYIVIAADRVLDMELDPVRAEEIAQKIKDKNISFVGLGARIVACVRGWVFLCGSCGTGCVLSILCGRKRTVCKGCVH